MTPGAGITPTASTRLVALLGSPVAHSVTPQLQTAAFRAFGLDVLALAFEVGPGELADAVAGLGALGALGANITIPHKQAVMDLADELTAEAVAVGAANTLHWDQGRLLADNTDAAGLGRVLESDVGLAPGDGAVLVGAGGAARAAGVALVRAGARIEVVARRPEAAAELADRLRAMGGVVGAVQHPRLVVNATPVGLHGESLPDRFLRLRRGQVALDLIYGPLPTPFLRAAEATGATALDGVNLLVAQGALAFERWTGRPAPVDVMRAAARSALGHTATEHHCV